MKQSGFTLIEILIALAVFAILSSVTAGTLYRAFDTRSRLNLQSEQLTNWQIALSLLDQDVTQVINRPIRTDGMMLLPAFGGQIDSVQFTRSGIANPQSELKRSQLERVSWFCNQGMLIRRYWAALDPVDRKIFQERVIFRNLQHCQFAYLAPHGQINDNWSSIEKKTLPQALQVTITFRNNETLTQLYLIPGGLYSHGA